MRGGRGVSKVVEVEKKERRFRVCGRNWEEFFRGRYLGQVKLAYHEQRTTSSFFLGTGASEPRDRLGAAECPWTVDRGSARRGQARCSTGRVTSGLHSANGALAAAALTPHRRNYIDAVLFQQRI
jgi:hypothetical protein